MRNLIKAQNYQIKRDNGIYYILLIGALFLVAFWADFMAGSKFSEITGGMAARKNGEMCTIVTGILVALLTCRMVGWDFNDKTLNYELLAGHSRAKVYWSRVIVSMKWCLITVPVLLFVPMLFFGIVNGWGVDTDMGDVVLRHVLVLFPLFRFACECVLLSVIMRNCYMSMIIGYMIYYFTLLIEVMQALTTKVNLGVHFASTNVNRLLMLDNILYKYASNPLPIHSPEAYLC